MTPIQQMGHDLLAIQNALREAERSEEGEAAAKLLEALANLDQVQGLLTEIDDGMLKFEIDYPPDVEN